MKEPERIIAETIALCAATNPMALARAILEELWEVGYDVRHRPEHPDMIENPDSRYTPEEEAEAAADFAKRGPKAIADVFRRQADEPRNTPIRDKIIEAARKLDGLG